MNTVLSSNNLVFKPDSSSPRRLTIIVIPAQAGIHVPFMRPLPLDSSLRGNDMINNSHLIMETNMNTQQKIEKQLSENPIILYMKGVPDSPECGFSGKAVAALKATGIPFAFVNVLASPFIREGLPKISRWPTFPQLFIHGELIGGSDIIESMAAEGLLLPALQDAVTDNEGSDGGETISASEVEQLIKADYDDASVTINGEGCDLEITVVSSKFDGLTLVKQQQGVMAALAEPISTGRLHAVTIKAYTPDKWLQIQQTNAGQNGLLQIQL